MTREHKNHIRLLEALALIRDCRSFRVKDPLLAANAVYSAFSKAEV